MLSMFVFGGLSLFFLFVSLSLWMFNQEMKKKMQYKDFILDAEDGIYNNFTSNNTYGFSNTKGLRVVKQGDWYIISSQSKLSGVSVIY